MAVSEQFRKIQPRLKDFHNGTRQLRPRAGGVGPRPQTKKHKTQTNSNKKSKPTERTNDEKTHQHNRSTRNADLDITGGARYPGSVVPAKLVLRCGNATIDRH